MSIITLSLDVLIPIIAQLDYKDILMVRNCNKYLCWITKNDHMWRHKLITDFPTDFLPPLEKSQIRCWWYSQFDAHLRQFNHLLGEWNGELPDSLLVMINQMIKELGPLVYTQMPTIFSKLPEPSYKYDSKFLGVVENGIISCFSPQDSQLRGWWSTQFDSNLTQFNKSLEGCPLSLLKTIDDIIIELGPLVYVELITFFEKLLIDIGQLDDQLWDIVAESINNCFGPKETTSLGYCLRWYKLHTLTRFS
jgi:hypothetical protein